jgi:predicted PurR-regulated permease PerM
VAEPRPAPPSSAPSPRALDGRPVGTWQGGLGRIGRACLHLLLIAAALYVLAWAYMRLRVVILPIVVAVFVCALLGPVAAFLKRRGVPAALAAGASMLGFALVVGGTIALLAPTVADELGDVGTSVQEGLEQALTWLAQGPLGISRAEIEQGIQTAIDRARENSSTLGRGVLSGAVLLAEVVAGLLLAVVLVFFFLKDGEGIWRWVVERMPRERQGDTDAIGRRAWGVLTGYLRGVAVIAVVDAVLIGIALLLIGVPLVLPLMVLTFFGAFLPLVGAVLAGAVAALVALVTEGVIAAVLVVVAITVIQQVEGDVLYPFVVGRAIELHPVAILLALTAGSVIAGIVGAIVAVPLAAVGWNAAVYLRERREGRLAAPDAPPAAVALPRTPSG